MRSNPAHQLIAVAAAAGTGVITAGAAAASPPQRSTLHVEGTYVSSTSEDCGFDILLGLEGSTGVTDFLERDGELGRSRVTHPSLFRTSNHAEAGTPVTSHGPDAEHATFGHATRGEPVGRSDDHHVAPRGTPDTWSAGDPSRRDQS